jgi:type IV pilus assembly protein PilE
MRAPPVRSSCGFTLIELLVVVAVVGILAAVAYPAFTSHLQRSRRADATAALTAVVQAQERYRANRSNYASSFSDLQVAADTTHYSLTLSGGASSFVSGYVITAVPRSGSPQASDRACAQLVLMLSNATLQYTARSADNADTSAQCWPK